MFLPLYDDNPVKRVPVVTVAIIALNVICHLGLESLDYHQQRSVVVEYGFIPARLDQLLGKNNQPLRVDLYPDLDPRVVFQGKPRFKILEPSAVAILGSLLTCMFLHGGWLHLLGNMWFFWIFGNNIEDRLGPIVFLLFYLIGGVAATLCHWAMQRSGMAPVIGASGAVAVALGAYLVSFPSAHVHVLVILGFIFTIRVPALVVLGLWFMGQVFAALAEINLGRGGGIALWAHIGGFVFGMLVIPLLPADGPKADRRVGPDDPDHNWPPEEKRLFDSPPRRFESPPSRDGY